MNQLDKEDLIEIKRSGALSNRERVLLEALEEANGARDALTGIFDDYPSARPLGPDLERIRKTLKELRATATDTAEAWFTEEYTPAPKLDSSDTAERLAAVCLKISDLFNDTIMDFDDLDALVTVEECYEIAEKAWKEI